MARMIELVIMFVLLIFGHLPTGSGRPGGLPCVDSDIEITQSAGYHRQEDQYEYHVHILNRCACTAADLHVDCGNFSDSTPVNTAYFTLYSPGDCVLRDVLLPGKPYEFVYTSRLPFPMKYKTVEFCAY